jgi:hypothetical protein
VATANPEPRNLSPASGIDDYVGKSYRVSYVIKMEEVWPERGKIDHAGRETTIYVKSKDNILTRFVGLPLSPTGILRYSRAPPGVTDQGIQVSYGNNQLLYSIPGPNYQVKITIGATGSSCTARVVFELQPNQQYYLFGRSSNGDPYKLSAMTGENVVCLVSPGDAIGEPQMAAATQTPASNAPAASSSPSPACHQDAWHAASLNNETASANQTTTGGAACIIHLQSGLDSPYASIESPPKNGTLSLLDPLTLKYQPNPGFKGSDKYIFHLCGSKNGRSGCSTVTYNVTAN